MFWGDRGTPVIALKATQRYFWSKEVLFCRHGKQGKTSVRSARPVSLVKDDLCRLVDLQVCQTRKHLPVDHDLTQKKRRTSFVPPATLITICQWVPKRLPNKTSLYHLPENPPSPPPRPQPIPAWMVLGRSRQPGNTEHRGEGGSSGTSAAVGRGGTNDGSPFSERWLQVEERKKGWMTLSPRDIDLKTSHDKGRMVGESETLLGGFRELGGFGVDG